MKTLFTLAASLILSTTSFAFEEEHSGYLQSGDGLCTVRLEKQNDYLHQLQFITNDYTVKAVNIELTSPKWKSHQAIFEKENDEYLQLYFGMPLPKTYSITLNNLGKGRYQIIKTRLTFGVKSFTSKDICITQY